MKKRTKKKKKRRGKFLLLLVLVGLLVGAGVLFRQEILDSFKPIEKKLVLPGEKKRVIPKQKREPEEKRAPEDKRLVRLFFADNEEEYLIGEKREILKRETREEAKDTLRELIKGPKGDLVPTLPPHTRLLDLQIDEGGVAKVNFDQTLSKAHPGGSSAEMMTLYSIVNSLALNFPQIKRVQILIGGKPAETIAGHLSLREPVSPKLDLVKE